MTHFSFGTGKIGELAGFASAIILALIALFICGELVVRILNPVAIHFNEAIAIAVLGLVVNLVSAWLLAVDHLTMKITNMTRITSTTTTIGPPMCTCSPMP